MSVIKWRDSFAIGVESMDKQHKHLIDIINRLYTIIREDREDDSLEKIIDEMHAYAEKHLQDEEALLQKSDYPDLNGHIAIHSMYRERITKLEDEAKKNNNNAKEMYAFLREWWTAHIMSEDKKYGAHFAPKENE